MTKIIFPTPMQASVVSKPENKRITVICTGRGSGKSTALLFKALQSDYKDCTIISPTYRITQREFFHAHRFLHSLGFRASLNSLILSSDKLSKKIKFASGEDPELTLGVSRDLIMFDNTDGCNNQTIYSQVSRAQDLVFTVDTTGEGFIKYKQDVDEEGKVIPNRFIVDYKESHWSIVLLKDRYLNWSTSQVSKLICTQMFREDVYLVKGGLDGRN